jgi:hypothetical protein
MVLRVLPPRADVVGVASAPRLRPEAYPSRSRASVRSTSADPLARLLGTSAPTTASQRPVFVDDALSGGEEDRRAMRSSCSPRVVLDRT